MHQNRQNLLVNCHTERFLIIFVVTAILNIWQYALAIISLDCINSRGDKIISANNTKNNKKGAFKTYSKTHQEYTFILHTHSLIASQINYPKNKYQTSFPQHILQFYNLRCTNNNRSIQSNP